MGSRISSCINTATGAGAVAVVWAALAQHLSSKQSELCSEICCWAILPLLIRASRRSEHDTFPAPDSIGKASSHRSYSVSLWVVALCLAATSWYVSEFGTIELLVSAFSQLYSFVSELMIYSQC